LNRIPERNEKIIWKTVQEEAVLLDSRNGRYFGLNPVGCSFWQHMDGKRTLGEIINLLIEEYDIDRSILVSDIADLIEVLKNKELLFIK